MPERTATDRPQPPSRVIIAGAGIAGLEAAAALRSLAGHRVSLTLVAPDRWFAPRPLGLYAAFGIDAPPSLSVASLAEPLGADLVDDRITWVDRGERAVHCGSGATLSFDALVLGLGARAGARYPHAITVDDKASSDLQRLTADVTSGRVRRVALIVPERLAWPLPLYEVALMTAALGAEHHRKLALTLITTEATPLQAFGEEASEQMAALLRERGIEVLTGALCEVPSPDRVSVTTAGATRPRERAVDRVLALPELIGPHVRGLPCSPYGFIPIDRFCRVPGTSTIYAAGDGTDYPIKHGGIAAQQADVAAACIAAAAGAAVRARPFHPTIEGLLLTGGRPRYLSARLAGGHAFKSRMTTALANAPDTPAKLAAPHLRALLEEVSS
ncbi:MAG: FAD-dependent oxidoreductase [Solirubrobacteraceae bacterium]